MANKQRTRHTISTVSRVLASGEVAEVNKRASVNLSTGELVADKVSTTLMPIGTFMEAGTGDGVRAFKVELFEPIEAQYFDNDESNPVLSSDFMKTCYISGDDTVSSSSGSSTRSSAGRVVKVDAIEGVAVQCGVAITGPAGASGTGLSAANVADRAALAAISAVNRADGMLVLVKSDGALFRFASASSASEDEAKELVVAPSAGTGRWLRADKSAVIKVPIAYTMTDDAVIFTVPLGVALRLSGMPFWEVTTGFTGGTSSAIGVSASAIATADGSLLGGASGDLTATLGTSGIKPGTVGTALDSFAEVQAFYLKAADTLKLNRITSAFTAGAGFVCLPVSIMTPAA